MEEESTPRKLATLRSFFLLEASMKLPYMAGEEFTPTSGRRVTGPLGCANTKGVSGVVTNLRADVF